MTETHDRQDAEGAIETTGAVIKAAGAEPDDANTLLDPVATDVADHALRQALSRQLAAGISAALAPGLEAAASVADGDEGASSALGPDAAAPSPDDDLEGGIALVFAALHAARDEADDHPDDDAESSCADVDAITFRLLGELDRLWHQSAA